VKIQGVSSRTVVRISLYRRALLQADPVWGASVYSYQLAKACGLSAAQVRRDLMAIGYSGSPNAGYQVDQLLQAIDAYLDPPEATYVAVVGVGYLGRAIVSYLAHRSPKLVLTAAFDNDPTKTDRVISGVNCYPIGRLAEVMAHQKIDIGVVTVPAEHAQAVAGQLVDAGVNGILNFAPVHLHVPEHVVVEHIDMTVSLEKVAFFAREQQPHRRKQRR
jgi:redox-sensing transcriptional repressor